MIDAEGTVLLVTTMQPLALPTRPGFLFSTAWWSVEKMLSAENGLGAPNWTAVSFFSKTYYFLTKISTPISFFMQLVGVT